MLKILKNPDEEKYNQISQMVIDNSGFCPCSINKTEDTICICKEFKEQTEEGFCHCKRYVKVKVD